MPHTSHRKKKGNQSKRQEILDDDGWTRVTSIAQSSKAASEPAINGASHALCADGSNSMNGFPSTAVPMPAVKGSSLESMQTQFSRVEARWLETELCKRLRQILVDKALTETRKFSTCVLLGTGSFCGDAIHWVDRHESAYFQLAAFKTVVSTIERGQGQPVSAYAQEPYYNDLDTALLASLDVAKVEHPRGFELLDDRSFAYSPAAEPEVEQQILAREPQIWLHRSFDSLLRDDKDATASTGMVDRFEKTHECSNLPALDLKNFPFHGSVIWWKKQDDLENT